MLVFGDAHIFIYKHQCLLTLALHPNDHQQLPMPNLEAWKPSLWQLLHLFSKTNS